MIYETELMTWSELRNMKVQLNQKLGTDFEVNKIDHDEYYMVIFDIETAAELALVRGLERDYVG